MSGRQTLRGERVRLGAIRQADIDTIIGWDEDTSFLRALSSGPAYPRPELLQRAWWEKRLKSAVDYHLAIRGLADDRIIGTIHISEIEWNHRHAWISIGIGERTDRGSGLGQEALTLAIDFAFNDLNLHRLSLGVFGDNTPAIRLYERLGFTHEGVAREALERDGKRVDLINYGLLAREWRAMRETQ